MSATGHEKWVVGEPMYETRPSQVSGRQWPPMTLMSDAQIPGVGLHVDLGWIYDRPNPNPYEPEQVLDYDQLLLHIGMDADTPRN